MDDGIYLARYKGVGVMGYKRGKEYRISIEKRGHVYDVEPLGEGLDARPIQYASEISIRNNWEFMGGGVDTGGAGNIGIQLN